MSKVVTLSGYEISPPSGSLTVAAGTATGSLSSGTAYTYNLTYVTGFGETNAGSSGSFTATATGSAAISAIPVPTDPNIIAKRLYRNYGGGSSVDFRLLAELSVSTTTYSDIIADADLGAGEPLTNKAHSIQSIMGYVKLSQGSLHGVGAGITAGTDTQAGAYQLASEFNFVDTSSAGTASVRLPLISSDFVGQHILVANKSANTINIYPGTGQTINGGSANAAITAATGVTTNLISSSATNWISY